MKKLACTALMVVFVASSALCADDTKGRVNLPRSGVSDTKGPVQSIATVSVPNVVGKTMAEAISILDSAGFRMNMSGSGNTIKQQTPAANTKVAPGSTVTLAR